MNKNLGLTFGGLFIAALVAVDALAATTAPSRSAVNFENARASGAPATVSIRTRQPVTQQRNNVSTTRTARNIAKRAAVPNHNATDIALGRTARIITDAGDAVIRRALGLGRSATNKIARSTTPVARSTVPAGASRSRATAVFSDISKLGTGYNACRDAYNTCMDQFCAGANETYRRCYCSNTFHSLRDKEDALDAATTMLAQFEDNNLNAVTKTAEEVNAMYSATAGEMAIKNDTSGAAALLNDIGDLLSGKKKANETNNNMTSLNGLTIDFSSDLGDIWGTNTNSLFGDDSATDLSTMEGTALYSQAHQECMKLVADTCSESAVKNMVKSAYNILIAQDCNAYQKKLDQKTEQVKSTVRTAEKYLREARLEEYRSHNSADVNECMDKVEKAILQPTACGTDYARCLDYSGIYINSSTGEPIYSARLFGLNDIITLDGSADVLGQNPEFNKFLDSKRMYAQSALDTCRDIADTVWSEFKRNALIKISQAQDEKIEEVKMSCVSTMKECYDTQSGALKGFDDTTAQASGALAARAAKDMCVDKVVACAALYATNGDSVKCNIDKTGKITNMDKCGLASLRNFVDTVDDTRIAEGCGAAVESYLKQLCTPSTGDEGYPWNCRSINFGDISSMWNDINSTNQTQTSNPTLVDLVKAYANNMCGGDVDNNNKRILNDKIAQNEVIRQLTDLEEELSFKLEQKCVGLDGVWYANGYLDNTEKGNMTRLNAFYSSVFGNTDNTYTKTSYYGDCYENTAKARCLEYSKSDNGTPVAEYNPNLDECVFTDDWFKERCAWLGNSYFEDGVCYVAHD